MQTGTPPAPRTAVGPARTAPDPALAHRVRVAVALLARRLRRERPATEGLTASQLAALATLDRHGVMTLGELAAHEHVQPPSMTRIAASLEELGLASRTPDPRDGRQVLLAATAEGARILNADRKRREAWLHKRLVTLTPEERATLSAAAEIMERVARS